MYGKDTVSWMRGQLQESGADILELGVLRSAGRGEDCPVYVTTELPGGMDRKEGQLYALWLDQDPPPLGELPERSEETVDVVRITVTPEDAEERLAYTEGLMERGYLAAVMVEETGFYGDEELEALLRRTTPLRPWACFIMDTSGVLNEPRLRDVFAVFDREMDPGALIGYHGRDNLQWIMGFTKVFCRLCGPRRGIVDASAGGMGTGALHLDSLLYAQWRNASAGTRYKLSALEAARSAVSAYTEPKRADGARLAYKIGAYWGCGYRYVEYLFTILPDMDAEMLESILRDHLPAEEKGRFSRRACYNAFRERRREDLNLVIVVPTRNRPQAVDYLLWTAVPELYKLGIDIVIYDSSDHDETRVYTENFRMDGYENVFYERYEGIFDGFSLDHKVISAFKEHLRYDYIWVIRDGLIPLVNLFYEKLTELSQKGTDCIVVDASARNGWAKGIRRYVDPLTFFRENCARTTICGTYIFKSSVMERIIADQPLSGDNYGLWLCIAPLYQMAKEPLSSVFLLDDVFTGNPGSPARPSFWSGTLLRQWAEIWYHLIMGLPAVYDSAKESVLKITMSDFHPFGMRSLLTARAQGGFDYRLYREYRKYLDHVCDTSRGEFLSAAFCPRRLARNLVVRNRVGRTEPIRHCINYEQKTDCFHETAEVDSRLVWGNPDAVPQPWLTILIPSSGRRDFLEQALNSVLTAGHTGFSWDVLIIDSAPDDRLPGETEHLLRERNSRRVLYYRNSEALSRGGLLNRGFLLARGKWVLLLEECDFLVSKTLQDVGRLIRAFDEKRKPLGAISAQPADFHYDAIRNVITEDVTGLNGYLCSLPDSYSMRRLSRSDVLYTGSIGRFRPGSASTFLREAVLESGGFHEEFGPLMVEILLYNIMSHYQVYEMIVPLALARRETNEEIPKEETYRVIQGGYEFREYVYQFHRAAACLFRKCHYKRFAEEQIEKRNARTADHMELPYFDAVYDRRPGPLWYWFYEHSVLKSYERRKERETRRLANAAERRMKEWMGP